MVTQKKQVNNLIQEIKNKKVNIKGKRSVQLDLEPPDLDFLIKLKFSNQFLVLFILNQNI